MKKIVIGILTIIVVIAMLIIGKIQMDKYRVKSIAHSEEAKVAIERMFKNREALLSLWLQTGARSR